MAQQKTLDLIREQLRHALQALHQDDTEEAEISIRTAMTMTKSSMTRITTQRQVEALHSHITLDMDMERRVREENEPAITIRPPTAGELSL